MTRKVRDLIFEVLRAAEIRHVFGNPGTTELPFLDGFAHHPDISYVTCLHEAVAVGGAMGYALVSGKVGVANLHAGPGLAHGLSNLYNAWRGRIPILVTAGQHDTRYLVHEPILSADLVRMAEPFTKWGWEVRSAEELAVALPRALKVALTPPAGPVFLSLPTDVLLAGTDRPTPAVSLVAGRVLGDAAEVERAARLIAGAQNPVVVAGDGVARCGAQDALAEMAEAAGMGVLLEPLQTAMNFRTDHSLFLGHLGASLRSYQEALRQADLIVLVGYTAQATLPAFVPERLIPAARLVYLHVDPWEMGKLSPGEAMVWGDLKVTLPALTGALRGMLAAGAIAQRRARVEEAARRRRQRLDAESAAAWDREPIAPSRLMRELAALLPEDAVVVQEVVSNSAAVMNHMDFRRPDGYIGGKGGGLGHSMGEAIGAKVAAPGRTVVNVIGDGTFLYYPQALWTAAKLGLAVTFVVVNNRGYRILKQNLLTMDPPSERPVFTGMDIGDPDVSFIRLAEAFGLEGIAVRKPAEIRPALEHALTAGRPVVIDVSVHQPVP